MARGKFRDLTGERFGRLRVLERAGSYRPGGARYSARSEPLWRCLCDPALGGCGEETLVIAHSLTRGETKSCGCLRQETAQERMREMRATQRALREAHLKERRT